MGDSHPALADDFASSFSNPAGFAGLKPVIRFSGLDFRLSGTFWKLSNAFEGNDPSELYPLDEGNFLGAGLQGPFDVGYGGGGKAFRLRAYSSLDVLYPNLAVQSLFSFRIGAEFSGGWATRFKTDSGVLFDLGFLVKGFHEQRYTGEADVVEFFGLLTEPEYFLDMPFEVFPGFGMDAGMLVRFGERWILGLSVTDLFTMEFVKHYNRTRDALDGAVPDSQETRIRIPDLSVGASWYPVFFDTVEWFRITGVYLSFNNLLGGLETYPVNYMLSLAAGTEFIFWRFLALRVGFSEGMLAAGLGFRFGGTSIDMTIRGEELSNQPGVFSVADFRLAFTFETRPDRDIH